MATATETKRHPGRRKLAAQNVRDRHIKSIKEAEKKRRDLEDKAKKAATLLAERIDKATAAGVETKDIADSLGISRQMVYKHVRERVDGKPLAKPKAAAKPSTNGSKKPAVRKTATKATTKKNPLARGKKKPAAKKA